MPCHARIFWGNIFGLNKKSAEEEKEWEEVIHPTTGLPIGATKKAEESTNSVERETVSRPVEREVMSYKPGTPEKIANNPPEVYDPEIYRPPEGVLLLASTLWRKYIGDAREDLWKRKSDYLEGKSLGFWDDGSFQDFKLKRAQGYAELKRLGFTSKWCVHLFVCLSLRLHSPTRPLIL